MYLINRNNNYYLINKNNNYYCVDYKFSGLCLTSLDGKFDITLDKHGSPSFNLKYSFNGEQWSEFANSSKNIINTITLQNTGDKVYFKGTYTGQSINNYLTFSITGNEPNEKGLNISGDILSILDEDNFETMYDISSYPFAFYSLFFKNLSQTKLRDCDGLILKATTLSESCYHYMFRYNQLKDIGRLTLPAMNMVKNCYYGMFEENRITKTACSLPSMNLAEGCYRAMYSMGTNIEILPELPATTLVANCYRYIYNSCSSAKYLKIGYTGNFSATYFNTWVGNLFSSSGDFYYNGTDTTRGANAIPTGWTVHTF